MSKEIFVIIAGDTYLGGGRVRDIAISGSAEKLFGEFLEEIQKADLAITNLESPLINNGKPILKIGPNLKSPVESLPVLKEAGFDLITLANNHTMDYGVEGLESTLKACTQLKISTLGAGLGIKEAQKPFMKVINGISIAVINIAENEFGTTENHLPGVHALNPIKNYNLIREVKSKVNHVIVIVHGGHEHYHYPSPRMKETYRFFVDAGASAVVGHHTHCYSGYEMYKKVPIFYSIGNFLFDDLNIEKLSWNEGYLVKLIIKKNDLDFEIKPYVQNRVQAGLRDLNEVEKLRFCDQLSYYNQVIQNDTELESEFWKLSESLKNRYSAFLEPHSLSYVHFLRNRNMFPSLLSERKKRMLLNLIRCESHRELLKLYLTNEERSP